jgi:N-acetylneuraminate synthase
MRISKTINIAGKGIGDRNRAFIIAEAGVNHNGRLVLAKGLVDAAKAAGADAVKFQTFKTSNLVTARAPKAAYQRKFVKGKSQAQMLKALELSEKDFVSLQQYCRRKGILFLSTPFDLESADFLKRLNLPAYKISSGDLTNIPLLKNVAAYQKPIILSTGMATVAEIREALHAVYKTGNHKVVLLHCTSNYPTVFTEVNLRALETMRREFKVPVGYSDHTEGIEVSIAAAALGACVIEKHLTLSKKMSGPDHAASLDPAEFTQLVRAIRNIEKSFGTGIKEPFRSELRVAQVARKSIVAAFPIAKGEKISAKMLTMKRPGTGIPPKFFNGVLGRRMKRSVASDHLLQWNEMENHET